LLSSFSIKSVSHILEVNDLIFKFCEFRLSDLVVVDLGIVPAVNYTISHRKLLFLKLFSMLWSACLNPSSVRYFTDLKHKYLWLRAIRLMLVGRSRQVPPPRAFVTMTQGWEDLSLVLGFELIIAGSTFSAFWRYQFGRGIFLLYYNQIRLTTFAWISNTFYLVKDSGIWTGKLGVLPVKAISNSFSDKSTNCLTSRSFLKWFKLN